MAHGTTPAAAAIPAMASAAGQAEDRIEPHRLVAFLVMVFGMFMAILDIQIVSASLTEIQAGLSALPTRLPGYKPPT
jgi:MFS transporter, DHA2 family, multidrug resistance protein